MQNFEMTRYMVAWEFKWKIGLGNVNAILVGMMKNNDHGGMIR